MRYILTLISALILSFSQAKAQDGPVVIELFTSQSCSSCPPADRKLSELAKQDNVIALSCNVTYWNHLHWKDTLSQQFCTDRQYDYSASMNRRGVFTPQMIINGTESAVGSRNGEVKKALGKAGSIAPITLNKTGNALNVTLPTLNTSSELTLYLIEYGAEHTQQIPSGENRGRTVSYTNPVHLIKKIGSWDGSASSMEFDVSNNSEGIALIAQQGKTGPILAAGKI